MTDPLPAAGVDTRVEPTLERPPGIPPWLKISAIAVLIVIVLVLVGSQFLGIQHGPGMGPGGH
jgi:hypothetical protein